MSIEEKLRNIILERYGTMKEFAFKVEIANSTLSSIMDRGVNKANIGNIIKICKELDISADELAQGRIVPNNKALPELPHMTDIEDIIKCVKNNISTYSNITIDGELLSENEILSVLDALDLCVEFIKRNHSRERVNQ